MTRPPVQRDGNFAVIPEWIVFHDTLSPQAIRLYAVLSRYADRAGHAYPSRARLAADLHVSSPKTVDRALRELEDAGAVSIECRYDAAGDRTSNGYTVHNTPAGVGTQMTPPLVTNDTGGRDTNDTTGRDTDDSVNESHLEEVPPTPTAAHDTGDTTPPLAAALDVDEHHCPTHPTPVPGRRCCGTTPKQLQARTERHRKAAEAEQRRRDAAARAAQRAQARAAQPDPDELARRRQLAAQAKTAAKQPAGARP